MTPQKTRLNKSVPNPSNNRYSLRYLAALISLLIVVGCAGTVDRGSLSEAVENSKDDHRGERRVENSHETDTTSGSQGCLFGFLASSTEPAEPKAYAEAQPHKYADNGPGLIIPGHHYFGLRAVTSNRFSRNYTNSTGCAFIWLDHYKQKRAMEMSLQFEGITTGEKSPLFGALDNLGVVSIGIHGRYFSTPDNTIMGLYFKWGVDVSEMFWKYRNPITSNVYDDQHNLLRTDVIHNDGLTGFSGDAGAGWSFLQTKNVQLSVEALLGGTLFWFKTYQGFSNDMFNPDAYIKCHLEMLIGRGE